MNPSENQSAIFPKGERAPSEYFTGTAYINMLVPQNQALNTTIANVVFEAGCRNNWHTHKGGQILICIEGQGYYQEKGKPIQLLQKGDVVQILSGIVHWHGATPDNDFAHIAVNPNLNLGIVEWLEPVTDEEYKNYKGR
jgi:quercetin dioxygenase-like cupin family protein